VLRKSIVSKIYNALEKTPFTLADFNVVTPDEEDELLLITFLPQDTFQFRVVYLEREESGDKSMTKIMSPGFHKMKEGQYISSLSYIHEDVGEWGKRIREELRASLPVYEEIDQIRELVEEHLKSKVENEDSPFSNSEIDELRSKFDDLASKFEELAENNEITQKELNKLKREMGAVKENLKNFPKGVWYRTAATRIFSVFSKIVTSSEGRKVLAKAAKKALELE